jgi:hypothetical protein
MKINWRTDGAIWTTDGIRQDQSFGIEKVPSVVPEMAFICQYILFSKELRIPQKN